MDHPRPDSGRCDAPRLRLGLIGAGAVAEHVHLPAIHSCPGVSATVLVDERLDRARQLAARFEVPRTTGDHRAILGDVDAAVVALPNHLHAPVASELLDAGVHVLVEKPMALTTADCDAMIAAAQRTGRVLAVGLVRRFSDSLQFVRHALEAGLIGPVSRFHLREGGVFRWPVTSDAIFRPGGGVLVDAGSHALDLLLWWLGNCQGLAYFDDARGGVEADCRLELRMENGATGVVELSRLRDLPNTCVLVGSRGVLEVGTKTESSIRLSLHGHGAALSGQAGQPGTRQPKNLAELCRLQLRDFRDAILRGREPAVPGAEGRRAIDLIERCYRVRQPLRQEWEAVEPVMIGAVT